MLSVRIRAPHPILHRQPLLKATPRHTALRNVVFDTDVVAGQRRHPDWMAIYIPWRHVCDRHAHDVESLCSSR
jgi:hypothetical protein